MCNHKTTSWPSISIMSFNYFYTIIIYACVMMDSPVDFSVWGCNNSVLWFNSYICVSCDPLIQQVMYAYQFTIGAAADVVRQYGWYVYSKFWKSSQSLRWLRQLFFCFIIIILMKFMSSSCWFQELSQKPNIGRLYHCFQDPIKNL